ncbi:MAG: 3-deoxy-manno-octulosonate cytidylyltransferase [Candidatus Neomarinimicrobiota bacterium]
MILGVIPARLNSTRFPNKILYPLNGKPVIDHVFNRAKQSSLLDNVIVAVDSEKTLESIDCSSVIMTSDSHQSGTDRVAEVADKFDCDIVVNIQGDEPGIEPYLIDNLISLFDNPNVEMASVASTDLRDEDFANDNVVKVNLNKENYALSFVRGNLEQSQQYYRHVGIYAYRKKTLDLFTSLEQSLGEKKYSLEQLRALDNNIAIKLLICDFKHRSIDTKEDLKNYEN